MFLVFFTGAFHALQQLLCVSISLSTGTLATKNKDNLPIATILWTNEKLVQ
jgi:hypothetical protein